MIRFAILAGVSTDAQAKDNKLSIPDQIANCRALIKGQGIESAGPYIMDGYSRTGYDSLDVAMSEIPPLNQAITEAVQNKYDILLMDNYDRLGDLGFIVKTRFKKIRKQLHSVRQSGRIVPPELYDPYADDSADIQMHVEGMIQTYRINKIRRGWNIGVPDRARAGLHPLSIPYGYKSAGPNEPAILIPEKAELLRRMKDMFLAGKTYSAICAYANSTDVKPRHAPAWNHAVIKRILFNRFYAGITSYGKKKIIDGKRIDQPRSQWVTGLGRHEPLWDDATYAALLAEDERREANRSRAKKYAISGLLYCAACDTRLYRHGKLNSRFPVYLVCGTRGCTSIKYDLAHKLVAQKIVTELKKQRHPRNVSDPTREISAQIQQAQARRVKVQEGYENNLYTATEASQRISTIEKEIEKLTAQVERIAQRQQHQQSLLKFAEQDLEKMQQWILKDDPTTVNHLLTALCEKITVTPSYEMVITFR